ncbi:glycosyl transferase family 2 [Dyadobacter jejuensis]|uniref:Glycosyl transferase family 2 n=1 Tax=Dyadobacter jejuensis TaxID=1082580 RepID=A0A316AQF7_9BACT|nr:glycosyltransferase [Dyadobacter jejuensis]PWJ59010.1 glycosyl transferase family 2 [Dyadobacter jejuensis]
MPSSLVMADKPVPAYSIIIPVYNRPDELRELLTCLTVQTFHDFEIVVVEDGSAINADQVVESFSDRLNISYYYKENGGQGFARNHGFERAKGHFFILFDSDALVEPTYMAIVDRRIKNEGIDMYGGPDTDHPSFSAIQKAISYSMTSLYTTGGIRGKKNNMGGVFHPRSFNMGLSREVWLKTGGFQTSRMGEDIIFSIRALAMGFKSTLIPEAFIYHKRRTQFKAFFRQLHFFGRARINIGRYYPQELKLVHTFPMIFTLGLGSLPFLLWFSSSLFLLGLVGYAAYFLLVFTDALRRSGSWKVARLGVVAAVVQLTGYGLGFMSEGWTRLWENKAHRETGATVEYPS